MAAKKEKKNLGIPPRNKQSYAQYVWIRYMFTRLDAIENTLKVINESIEELNKAIIENRKKITDLENRKVYKEEKEQSNEAGTP